MRGGEHAFVESTERAVRTSASSVGLAHVHAASRVLSPTPTAASGAVGPDPQEISAASISSAV